MGNIEVILRLFPATRCQAATKSRVTAGFAPIGYSFREPNPPPNSYWEATAGVWRELTRECRDRRIDRPRTRPTIDPATM